MMIKNDCAAKSQRYTKLFKQIESLAAVNVVTKSISVFHFRSCRYPATDTLVHGAEIYCQVNIETHFNISSGLSIECNTWIPLEYGEHRYFIFWFRGKCKKSLLQAIDRNIAKWNSWVLKSFLVSHSTKVECRFPISQMNFNKPASLLEIHLTFQSKNNAEETWRNKWYKPYELPHSGPKGSRSFVEFGWGLVFSVLNYSQNKCSIVLSLT